MLKKLFAKRSLPTNDGDRAAPELDKVRWIKAYELELSNMEGAPSYPLTTQLSIGSEIGDIVIADPSVSPKHCTFILQQEVVSLIDHASINGTMINGNKITPGRYIILEDTDVVSIGDLEIKLLIKNVVATEDEIPGMPSLDNIEKLNEIEEDEEIIPPLPKPKLVDKSKTVVNETDGKYATNALIRILAVFCDLLLAYTFLIVFSPFDEFRELLNFIPSLIEDYFGKDISTFWQVFQKEQATFATIFTDIYEFLSTTFHFESLLLMFFILRLTSTLVMGVSISEFMLGITSSGHRIWKRIGGALRVVLGLITGPLLIFDIPAIVSRRTFKEMLTFTRTHLRSKFKTILFSLAYVPILIGVTLLAPLVQGLEFPLTIPINDKIESRMKVAANPTVSSMLTQGSRSLKLNLNYNPAEVSLMPLFKFQGIRRKLQMKGEIDFYFKENHSNVTIEYFKSFDLKHLLSIGIMGNIFLFDRFPQIHNYVYSSGKTHSAFRVDENGKSNIQFANELISFAKMSFELNQSNVIPFMESYSPLIQGPLNFKYSFLSLLEYKDFQQINFIKLGNTIFMKISYLKQRPFDLLIPLIKGEGRIYKVNFENKEKLNELSNKFYKSILDKSDWQPMIYPEASETLNAMQTFDYFMLAPKKFFEPALAQSLYGYYFESSAEFLKQDDAKELEIWLRSIDSVLKIIEITPSDPAAVEDARRKLLQNFKDLREAIVGKNKEYFGLTQNQSI